jgi:hypothetical protein
MAMIFTLATALREWIDNCYQNHCKVLKEQAELAKKREEVASPILPGAIRLILIKLLTVVD